MKSSFLSIARNLNSRISVPALCVCLLLPDTGCSKTAKTGEPDGHEGHNHGAAMTMAVPAKKQCPEHNMALDECGICRPEGLAALKPGEAMKLRMSDAESASIAGVQLEKAAECTLPDAVECYAELCFNQNRYAQVSAPVGGILQEVQVDLGSQVSNRQVLARLWSATISDAIAKAVLSHQTLARELRLRAERVNSAKDLQEAEANHQAACQPLRMQGFTEEQIEALVMKPEERVLLELRAPVSGEIVEKSAVQGSQIEPGKHLFSVADRSVMWAMLSIPEGALPRVALGQLVELQVEALPGRLFAGKLTWMSAEVDERTRMAKARVEVANPEGLLKGRMFAQARILVGKAEAAVVVSKTAIQRIDGRPFVFVKTGDDLFDARAVRLGVSEGGRVEISEGLRPLELVAVNHGFALKSALLISRLGAGCADD